MRGLRQRPAGRIVAELTGIPDDPFFDVSCPPPEPEWYLLEDLAGNLWIGHIFHPWGNYEGRENWCPIRKMWADGDELIIQYRDRHKFIMRHYSHMTHWTLL